MISETVSLVCDSVVTVAEHTLILALIVLIPSVVYYIIFRIVCRKEIAKDNEVLAEDEVC